MLVFTGGVIYLALPITNLKCLTTSYLEIALNGHANLFVEKKNLLFFKASLFLPSGIS